MKVSYVQFVAAVFVLALGGVGAGQARISTGPSLPF